MNKLLFIVGLVGILLISGCEYTKQEVKTIETIKTNIQKAEVPKVCEELITIFTIKDYPGGFSLDDNKLTNDYEYVIIKDEYGRITNFPTYTTGVLPRLSCNKGSKVGENVNYYYCEPTPIKKRETIIDKEGVIQKDVETFYVIEDMVLKYKEDITELAPVMVGRPMEQVKNGEKWEVVSRKCYQTDFKDYSH